MIELTEFMTKFGTAIGLLLYITIKEIFPFLKEKYWPAIREDKQERQLFRRESDAKILDLEERKVIADEQIAKNLILLTERMGRIEVSIQHHDDRVVGILAQLVSAISGLQAVNSVLLDRISRGGTMPLRPIENIKNKGD